MPSVVMPALTNSAAAAAVAAAEVVTASTAAAHQRASLPKAASTTHIRWTPEETEILVTLYERLKPITEQQFSQLSDAFTLVAKQRGSPQRSLEALKSRFSLIARKTSTGGGTEASIRTRAIAIRKRIHTESGSAVINDRDVSPARDDDDPTAEPGDSADARELQDQLRLRHSKAAEAVARLDQAIAAAAPTTTETTATTTTTAAADGGTGSSSLTQPRSKKRRQTMASTLREVLLEINAPPTVPPAGVPAGCAHKFVLAQLAQGPFLFCEHCGMAHPFFQASSSSSTQVSPHPPPL